MTTTHRSELILGGAKSGKSRRALALGQEWRGPVAFLATAEPLDAHMRARIARHQAERPRGWTTVEEPLDIAAACRRLAGRHDVAIIDCLTLWVSNRMLRGDADEATLAAADDLVKVMSERVLSLIVVSNEVGEGVVPATESGVRFRDLLGSVNQRVAAAADRVTLMVAGIPVSIKDPR
ncbi:MAG TPA: bifunctional adenosylcobinamide kinase/adenosylcobinamide-phosphate guanylyltransferase [Candidatus Methylomirabilis sp.]|nr:bifunctional adenosylcobinamide kinase/adenosylcobinamide-phosphate guanylyltransferase [Candidatus Methylomirabilis sp.]